ncbi:hypothetical protein ACFC58_03035 [Kitasatospora purpeofusca]|uniref:hypothetical protein n=1 Tax=Kitasatospora purpeofusca TaxID=67352 RepID=UPI0035E11B8A
MSGDLVARLSILATQFRPAAPTPYVLYREVDVSGVSGTGVVAEGCMFSSAAGSRGVTRWRGERGSTVVWDRPQDAEEVHGHGGATRMIVLPVPGMLAALLAIASLGDQRGRDPWSEGWNEALRIARRLIDEGLDLAPGGTADHLTK